ncbi:hypothetical protein ScPMuIL_001826 [Solemya velum]
MSRGIYVCITAVVLSMVSSATDGVYVNLAQYYKGNVTQSSTHTVASYLTDASNAVDNNTDQNMTHGHCSHTADKHRGQAWWKLEFTTRVNIDSILIYHRYSALYRFQHTEVYVSDTGECGDGEVVYRQLGKPTEGEDIFNITDIQKDGKYLTVCRERKGKDNYVQLCEVVVMGCKYGRYGTKCEHKCGACSNATCNLSNGKCPGACENEHMGPLCNKSCLGVCKNSLCTKEGCDGCVEGNYSKYCDKMCPSNCQKTGCEQFTGVCVGCDNNTFWNENCTKPCPINCSGKICSKENGHCIGKCVDNNSWGDVCNESCPANCKDNICNKLNGSCDNGCKPSYWTPTCNRNCSIFCSKSICSQTTAQCESCVKNKYGNTCNKTCPSNCRGKKCKRDNGLCVKCKKGYYGKKCLKQCSHCMKNRCHFDTGHCKDTCQDGFRGDMCNQSCPYNCKESVCNKFTAECSNGCSAGYHGLQCDSVCEAGYYGFNCSEKCGSCVGGAEDCLHTNGSCRNGCMESFSGPSCQHKAANSGDEGDTVDGDESDTAVVLGICISVLMIAIVLAVIIIIKKKQKILSMYRRRGSEQLVDGSEMKNQTEINRLLKRCNSKSQNCPDGREKTEQPPMLSPEDTEATSKLGLTSDTCGDNIKDITCGILVDNLKEYITSRTSDDFEVLFKEIVYGSQFPHEAATHENNIPKNRFRGVYPYDHSRVKLELIPETSNSDYIHANYIDGYEIDREYIAAQGPLKNTIHEMWRMVVQEKCGKIIMLTNLREPRMVKCERYWPLAGECMELSGITLTLASEEVRSFYTIRNVTVVVEQGMKKETRLIEQYHYTAWPDHGTADPRQLAVFYRRVTRDTSRFPGPYLVHCSAGIGRTGTFLGLDALARYGCCHKQVDVSGYVAKMRKNRMNMVQTSAQFQLVHEVLYETLMYPQSSIPSTQFVSRYATLKEQQETEHKTLVAMLCENSGRCSDGKLPENKPKNRFTNIIPMNKHRPFLNSYVAGTTDYINAVIVRGHLQGSRFLVTQLPLKNTVIDFWRMIFDHESSTIVLLNPLEDREGTRKQQVKVFHTTSWCCSHEVPPTKELILDLIELVNQRQKEEGVHPITVQCM